MFEIKIGVMVQDKLTGFAGRCTGRAEYITGCNQYLVLPTKPKDGGWYQAVWLDEHRLEVTDSNAMVLQPEEQAEQPKRTRFGALDAAPVK